MLARGVCDSILHREQCLVVPALSSEMNAVVNELGST